MLAPRPNPKLEVHSLSAVRDCLFNVFATNLHAGGRSSIRTWGRAMPWWQGRPYHGFGNHCRNMFLIVSLCFNASRDDGKNTNSGPPKYKRESL